MFITLLSVSRSLATKCVSLMCVSELCMIRPFLNYLNPVELKYYPFVSSLDKCNGSCNSFNVLFMRLCVASKTKDVNVKIFNMTTNKNETKTMVKHISYGCRCKCNSANCNEHANASVKIVIH